MPAPDIWDALQQLGALVEANTAATRELAVQVARTADQIQAAMATVQDHEHRLRAVERRLYAASGIIGLIALIAPVIDVVRAFT